MNESLKKGTLKKLLEIGLVESGAGTLGSLEVGGVTAILETVKFRELVGTSAGSIVAALLSIGFNASELKCALMKANYKKLLPFNWLLGPFRGNLASNRNAIAWLKELTDEQQLKDCVVPLTTIASDLETSRVFSFSSKYSDDQEIFIWEAVMASMSIPDIFPLFKNRFCDGGLLNNLAVNYLDFPRNGKNLALRVVEASKKGPVKGWIDEQERLGSMGLSGSEYDMVLIARLKKVPVIDLPAGYVGFLDRDMSSGRKALLFETGYETVKTWLDGEAGKEWLA